MTLKTIGPRIRRSLGSRGQSTVELALIAPLVVGLFALTLQGGLVVSDQVQLEQFANEGTQWAFAHRNDPNLTTNDVRDHVYAQMCGGVGYNPSTPGPTATRFCKAGAAALTVSVPPAANLPVAQGWPMPWVDAEAAACKRWAISVSPATTTVDPRAAPPGNAGIYTVTLTDLGGGGGDVSVSLSGGKYPSPIGSTPVFDPPVLATDGTTTSTLRIDTRLDTVPGTYTFFVSAKDTRCAPGSNGSAHAAYATMVVLPPAPSLPPIVLSPVLIDSVKSSLLPINICVGFDLTINGANFHPGAKVYVGPNVVDYQITTFGVNQMVVHFNGIADQALAGKKVDVTVINQDDGTSATMVNAVTIAQNGTGPCGAVPPPPPCVQGCQGPGYDPCTSGCTTPCSSGCSQPNCTATCSMPLCTSNCQQAGCSVGCTQPQCTQFCNEHVCAATCTDPACASGCDQDACAAACTPPSACTTNCVPPPSHDGCLSNCQGKGCVASCVSDCTIHCSLPDCIALCSMPNCKADCQFIGCVATTCPQPAPVLMCLVAGQELVVTITFLEPLVIPVITGNNGSNPTITMVAVQKVTC